MNLLELSIEWFFRVIKFLATFLYLSIFLQITAQPYMLLQCIRIFQRIIKALLMWFKLNNWLMGTFLCINLCTTLYLTLSIIKNSRSVHKVRIIKLRLEIIEYTCILFFFPKALCVVKKYLLIVKIELRLRSSIILWTIWSHHWYLSKSMSVLIHRWFPSLCNISLKCKILSSNLLLLLWFSFLLISQS